MRGTRQDLVQMRSKYDWRSLNEVSWAGLQPTVDPRSPLLRRVLWSILLAICFALMLAQCVDRISHYYDEPVRVRVRVTTNETLEYPAITVCSDSAPSSSQELPLKPSHLLSRDTNYTCWFGRGVRCGDRGSWKLVQTVLGPCMTFTLSETNVQEAGGFHNLFMRMFSTSSSAERSLVVLVHERSQTPAISVFFRGIVIGTGWSREIKIELRKFQLLNTRRHPCCMDPAYSEERCQLACFSQIVLRVIHCRLPFMADVVIEDCTRRLHELGMNVTTQLLTSGVWSANCSCPRPCIQTMYQTYPETTIYSENQLKTRVFFEALMYEEVSEELAYPVIALLCDLGATMGLLMGVSLLTVCELLEVVLSRLALVPRKALPSPVAPARNKQIHEP